MLSFVLGVGYFFLEDGSVGIKLFLKPFNESVLLFDTLIVEQTEGDFLAGIVLEDEPSWFDEAL